MTTRSAQRRHPKGFTLVELMVVVAIIGFVIAAAGAFLASPRDRRALSSSTSAFSSLVQQLRNRAMSNGAAVILVLEETQGILDPATGATVGRGSGLTGIQVFDAQGADCAPRESTTLIPAIAIDPEDPQRPYRHAVISRLQPATTSGVMTLCFTPAGRVVDPNTSRPVPAIGASRFGGEAFIEFRPVDCSGGTCTFRPDRSTLSIEFNGLVERLPDSFDLGGL